MHDIERVRENLEAVYASIEQTGRKKGDVQIVAVTKQHQESAILTAHQLGITAIGENYAQECIAKHARVSVPVEWHFVGQMQRRKIRALSHCIDVWHSVDRREIVDELARYVPGARIFVQRNMSNDHARGGAAENDVPDVVLYARAQGLVVKGLMCVAVPSDERETAKQFQSLRKQAETLDLPELSMGMSNDYSIAVAEGATTLRLGTTLFGARNTKE